MSISTEQIVTSTAIIAIIGLGFAIGKYQNSNTQPSEVKALSEADRWKALRPFNKMLEVRENVTLTLTKWEKESFGSVAVIWATVKNSSTHDFKDLEIICDFSAKSGTTLTTSSRVSYEKFRANSKASIRNLNMGWIHSQSSAATCRIGDLVVLD